MRLGNIRQYSFKYLTLVLQLQFILL